MRGSRTAINGLGAQPPMTRARSRAHWLRVSRIVDPFFPGFAIVCASLDIHAAADKPVYVNRQMIATRERQTHVRWIEKPGLRTCFEFKRRCLTHDKAAVLCV